MTFPSSLHLTLTETLQCHYNSNSCDTEATRNLKQSANTRFEKSNSKSVLVDAIEAVTMQICGDRNACIQRTKLSHLDSICEHVQYTGVKKDLAVPSMQVD